MEYPKNDIAEKRIKDLGDFIARCEANIKQMKEHIRRAKKEQNQFKKMI